jgi:hypothetical protein
MRRIDVANGDADGLCALHQLRLAEGTEGELVCGVKRDIGLLARVQAGPGDLVTVCDVSLEANRAALLRLLHSGARLRYFDHHHAGEIPVHAGLEAHIETGGGVCTSLIVDRHLHGAHRAWAVAACFGDGLPEAARALAAPLRLDASALQGLRELGECINYNAYGERVDDLHVAPAELYRRMKPFADPLRCRSELPVIETLHRGRAEDLARARAVPPHRETRETAAWLLPDAAWSRRVLGEFANACVAASPARACAVLAPSTRGGWIVSVRAPRGHAAGAAALCLEFATGGGRREAAGINVLPRAELARFLERFEAYFRGG